jgi:tRNA pseudouridine55 synthase
MATGLLIVGLGRATRLLGHIAGTTKSYDAVIRLGAATTTDDAEGETLGEPRDATGLTSSRIAEAMARYVGQIDQVPSAVSAIKVKGERAYALVRAGHSVELQSRRVTVTRFEMSRREDQAPWVDLTVSVDCSTGTYIRALARDLGRDLGVGGHLIGLRRTSIGAIDLTRAVTVDEIDPAQVISLAQAAVWVAPRLDVTDVEARDIAYGRALKRPLTHALVSIYYQGDCIALYRPDPADPKRAVASAVLITPTQMAVAGHGAVGQASEPVSGGEGEQ